MSSSRNEQDIKRQEISGAICDEKRKPIKQNINYQAEKFLIVDFVKIVKFTLMYGNIFLWLVKESQQKLRLNFASVFLEFIHIFWADA